MRRCLIAITALLFFLSASAFAFGNLQGAQLEQARAEAALHAEASMPASLVPEGQAGAHPVSHVALGDELPDLPESLPRVAAAQRPPVDAGPGIGERQRAALPPSLDGLLRPPQPAFSTV